MFLLEMDLLRALTASLGVCEVSMLQVRAVTGAAARKGGSKRGSDVAMGTEHGGGGGKWGGVVTASEPKASGIRGDFLHEAAL